MLWVRLHQCVFKISLKAPVRMPFLLFVPLFKIFLKALVSMCFTILKFSVVALLRKMIQPFL